MALSFCIALSSCLSTGQNTQTGTRQTETSKSHEEPQIPEKILIPLQEIKKQNNILVSVTNHKYSKDPLNPSVTEVHDSQNVLMEKTVTEEIEYLTEKKSFMDADNNILRYYVITKNESGKIIEKVLYSATSKLIAVEEFDYDKYGNNTQWRVYNSNESLLAYNNYIYVNGLNTRVDSYHANGTLAEYFIKEYSKSGTLQNISRYNADGKLTSIRKKSFKNGMISKEEFYNGDRTLMWYTNYIYVYSGQYIKVTKTTSSGDGKEKETVEQTCRLYNRKIEG